MKLIEYVNQGGLIMYLLVAINVVGLSILLWRFIVIFEFKKNINGFCESIYSKIGQKKIDDIQLNVNLMKEEIHQSVSNLEYGLNTIKIIASIAPLLGLLGTVVGILSAFQVISQQGLSNPSLFAGGIAMALVTTVGGLIVAIPHFIGYNYLTGMLNDLESTMEKIVLKNII